MVKVLLVKDIIKFFIFCSPKKSFKHKKILSVISVKEAKFSLINISLMINSLVNSKKVFSSFVKTSLINLSSILFPFKLS